MNLETVFDNVLTLYVKKLLAKEIAIDRRYQSDGYTINRYPGGDSPGVLDFAAECDGSAAWLAEKASRLKLVASSSEDFGTFEALEFLSLGIQGKLSLWGALQVVAESDARLTVLDFHKLIDRAKAQYGRVEERRLSLAAHAFSPNHPNIR